MAKWRWVAFFAVLAGAALTAVRQMPAPLVDQNYMAALAAADRLLSAWQDKNGPGGLALMSPGLRRRHSEAELRQWLAGAGPSVSRSFEIGPGRRLTESRYLFRVRIIERRIGQMWGQPRKTAVVLTRNGRGEWRGEVLPCGPEGSAPGGHFSSGWPRTQ